MKRKNLILAVVLIVGITLGAAPVMAAKPLKLGFVYIMSGPFATYGQFAKQGAELAIDEVNKAGGINGRQVEAYFEDTTGKPDVALRAIRKLVYQEKVDIVIGLDSSGVAKTIGPAMPQLKTPLIITHAATPDVTGSVCNKYVFRISVNIAQNLKAAAQLAADTDVKKWTTIGPDYAFGHQSWEFFEKYMKELKPGVALTAKKNVVFPPFKTTDYSSYINKLMQSDADGVLVSLWGGNLIDFVRQASEMGFFSGKYTVLCTLGAATEVLTALGDKMPVDLWVGTRYWFQANNSEMNNNFVKAFKSRYDTYPSYNSHGAYGAVYTYKAAAEKARSTDKDAIVKALENLTLELPVGTITIRAGDHQAVTDVTWGKTAADPAYPIRVLKPFRVFKGADVTPPVADTGCTIK